MKHGFLTAVATTALLASFGTAQFTMGPYTGGSGTLSGGYGSGQYVWPTITSKRASYYKEAGNPDAGMQLNAWGRVERLTATIDPQTQARRVRVIGGLSGRVYLWSRGIEALGMSTSGEVANGDWSTLSGYIDRTSFQLRGHYEADFALRVGGITVYTREYTGETDFIRRESSSRSLTILRLSQTFWVYWVPITVDVEAGAAASIGLDAALRPVNTSASLGGGANGYAFGSASAGLGIGCLQVAGIQVDLRLLNTTLGVNFSANMSGLSGTFNYRIEAIRILLKLFGDYCARSWSKTIWDKSFGIVSGSKTLI